MKNQLIMLHFIASSLQGNGQRTTNHEADETRTFWEIPG